MFVFIEILKRLAVHIGFNTGIFHQQIDIVKAQGIDQKKSPLPAKFISVKIASQFAGGDVVN